MEKKQGILKSPIKKKLFDSDRFKLDSSEYSQEDEYNSVSSDKHKLSETERVPVEKEDDDGRTKEL